MRIDPDLFETSLHEARHAGFGASRQMQVLAVHVSAYEGGYTDILLPFHAYQLPQHWAQDPVGTTHKMRNTIGMIVAPVAAEGKVFPGITGDSAKLGIYARWWRWLQPSAGVTPLPWLTLLAQARGDVHRWASAPGAFMAQYHLAHWLARAQDVDEHGWAWLWAQPFAAPLHQARPAVAPRPVAPRPAPAAVPKPPRKTYSFSTPVTARPADGLPRLPLYDWRTGFGSGMYGILA